VSASHNSIGLRLTPFVHKHIAWKLYQQTALKLGALLYHHDNSQYKMQVKLTSIYLK